RQVRPERGVLGDEHLRGAVSHEILRRTTDLVAEEQDRKASAERLCRSARERDGRVRRLLDLPFGYLCNHKYVSHTSSASRRVSGVRDLSLRSSACRRAPPRL